MFAVARYRAVACDALFLFCNTKQNKTERIDGKFIKFCVCPTSLVVLKVGYGMSFH